eukprot:Hpha_TRINITY_DN14439_c2_g6::TRINITY_DN14439_c2_g6_i1::g.157673::m.157673
MGKASTGGINLGRNTLGDWGWGWGVFLIGSLLQLSSHFLRLLSVSLTREEGGGGGVQKEEKGEGREERKEGGGASSKGGVRKMQLSQPESKDNKCGHEHRDARAPRQPPDSRLLRMIFLERRVFRRRLCAILALRRVRHFTPHPLPPFTS